MHFLFVAFRRRLQAAYTQKKRVVLCDVKTRENMGYNIFQHKQRKQQKNTYVILLFFA